MLTYDRPLNVLPLARNPNYCCDGWTFYDDIEHAQCAHLRVDEDLEYKCDAGFPLDEDEVPGPMTCPRRIETATAASVLSDIVLSFTPKGDLK